MKIAITGASGRMGRMLIEAVLAAPDMELAAALDRSDSPALGTDAGAFMGAKTGVTITDRTDAALAGCQVLIDFTRPEASMAYLDACRQHGVKMVIGTTGFSAEQRARIQQAAQDIAIVQAANMSPGVNAAIRLIELATQMLADTDIEVIAAQLGKPLTEIGVFAREGHTGPRQPGSIGFSTIRGGDIVGDHTVLFAGNGEQIEIRHRATSRAHYADGSLRACRFLADKAHGLYDMRAVLGLSSGNPSA